MALRDTTDVPSELPKYSIAGWETTLNGFILYMCVRSARLNIHVLTQNFHSSPIAIEAVQRATAKISSELDEPDLEEYHEEIALQFLSELQKLAPPIHHVGKLTLEEIEACQYYDCQLEFYDEVPRPSAITRKGAEEENPNDIWYDPQPTPFESIFPQFQRSEVEVLYDDPSTALQMIPDKVLVQGQLLFWKPSWSSREFKDVVGKYSKIYRSGLRPDQLPTSRLYGVVVDKKGIPRGQLYYWIDIDKTPTWEQVEQAPKELREKWVSQIQNTVSTLHDLDVIWGDVQARNVVIDRSGNAIVISFEGGAVKGWIDKDKMETKEGDLQGLERLVDYIMNDDSSLRLRDKEADLKWCGTER
ncbi:hypothetical protein BU16DRAFT_568164 [Lophium mytilinum]|uniref:Protein kinase domain-containing protein n=1 Tax=Lophium mytilinum TaxID=390894 RepID=A0A6A6Q8M3_9PEZI|nr:hypothetical protein BU16DRAFT_568164 [Lophium mytilinum]